MYFSIILVLSAHKAFLALTYYDLFLVWSSNTVQTLMLLDPRSHPQGRMSPGFKVFFILTLIWDDSPKNPHSLTLSIILLFYLRFQRWYQQSLPSSGCALASRQERCSWKWRGLQTTSCCSNNPPQISQITLPYTAIHLTFSCRY